MVIKSNVDVNYGLVKVKKPFQVNESIHVFDVCYDMDSLMIQTSVCVVPYSYSIFDSGAFQIDVTSNDNSLRCLIQSINDYILQKVKKYSPSMLDGKTFIDYLKLNRPDVETEFRLRFRNPHVDNVSTFDNKNNLIPTKGLSTFDRVVCLFQLQKLVIQRDSYYFQANVVQIKKLNLPMTIISKTCLIEVTQDTEEIMLPMVPSTVFALPPPPPPPPPSSCLGFRVSSQKPPQNVHTVVGKQKPTHVTMHVTGFKPPSLDEILRARTNLKSINNISTSSKS